MLYVQEYLKSGKSLKDLEIEHGVYSKITNGKISLNYDQLESKESDPLAQQCRGLVLEEMTFNVIACPFFRFFNIEQEGLAAKIDWNSAKYFNKLDGTCAIVYNYHGTWYIGTRSRSEADANAHDSGMTFSKLVDLTCKEMGAKTGQPDGNLQDLMKNACPNNTYIFELTTPLNRIVCNYNDFQLSLIGVRNNITLQEKNIESCIGYFSHYGVNLPEVFEFKNINHLIQTVREWEPDKKEGVVVCDGNFNRVKVKSPAYIAFNKLRDSLSTSIRGCVEIILLGKEDDVVGMLPEFISNRILKIKAKISKVLDQTNVDWLELKNIENQKEFALEAQKRLWPAALFAMKSGKVSSIKEFATFASKGEQKNISQTCLDSIFSICQKMDPSEIL